MFGHQIPPQYTAPVFFKPMFLPAKHLSPPGFRGTSQDQHCVGTQYRVDGGENDGDLTRPIYPPQMVVKRKGKWDPGYFREEVQGECRVESRWVPRKFQGNLDRLVKYCGIIIWPDSMILRLFGIRGLQCSKICSKWLVWRKKWTYIIYIYILQKKRRIHTWQPEKIKSAWKNWTQPTHNERRKDI